MISVDRPERIDLALTRLEEFRDQLMRQHKFSEASAVSLCLAILKEELGKF